MGKLGGFATNTLMSTVMSAVSMGTLGFGAYTAASSILSVVMGPVGIVGSGAEALYQVARRNARKPGAANQGSPTRYRLNSSDDTCPSQAAPTNSIIANSK